MSKEKRGYVPSLDGLRTLSVLFVLAYHLKVPHIVGGLLGVTVFFVLSGYLITSLLLAEFQKSGRINLPQFWLRRVKRLFPAIVLVIFTTAFLGTIFNHELLTKMRADVVSSLFFFNNWWQIFHNVSYFEALGSPSPLTTFWSLAIEEQFYLLWPPLLFFLLKLKVSKKTTVGLLGAMVIASVALMFFLYDPSGDPSRVYYGTDTRAFSLLIGALAAHLWPCGAFGLPGEIKLSSRGKIIFNTVGIISLIGLILMLIFADGYSAFLYRGGMLLVSILSVIVITNIVHPDSIIAGIFSLSPLVWIGKRSYGIYLWHYPLLLLMIPRNIASNCPIWLSALVIFVVMVGSAISYSAIEDPIRRGALGYYFKSIMFGNKRTARLGLSSRFERLKQCVLDHIFQVSICLVIFIVGLAGLIFVPPASSVETVDKLKSMAQEHAQNDISGNSQDSNSVDSVDSQDERFNFKPYSVLLIGDSVSLMAYDNFNTTFPGGHLDSKVNRRIGEAKSIYEYYMKYHLVGDTVVFALGTNGIVTDEDFDSLMKTVGSEKRVFFVNTRSPQDWMNKTNEAIRSGCARYSNAFLVDWANYSANRADLFDGDGTHLKYAKAPEYVALIKSAIQLNGGLPYEPNEQEVKERNDKLSQLTE